MEEAKREQKASSAEKTDEGQNRESFVSVDPNLKNAEII